MPNHKLIAALGVACALFIARPALAIDENAARQHFERATDAFGKGRYDDAVREYLLAYRASNDPSLLFNVAQSHRLAGHYSAALQYYRMYLQNTPDATDRAEVERQIKDMENKLDLEQKQTPKAPPPIDTTPPSTADAQPIDTTPAYPTSDVGPTSLHPGRAKIIAGAVTLGVGAALAITGVALGAEAKSLSDQLTSDNMNGVPFDPQKEQNGKTDQTLMGVFVGVGAAAAVVGAVVLGLGVKQDRAVRVAVVPSLSPTGAGAALTVRY